MRRLILPLAVIATLSACSYMTNSIPSYKLTVYQGNIVTQDMLDRLKPGMSKQQVRAILGTPLLEDPFHKNRWDYNYTVTHGGKIQSQTRLTVYFENDVFSRTEGQTMPNEKPVEASTPNAESSAPISEAK